MGKMLDTFADSKIINNLAKIKSDGYTAIGGYYFEHSAFKELLNVDYADKISDAGLYLVSVYENGMPTSVDYFTYEKGLHDGLVAIRCAKSAGQPHGTPIYFTVDYDASESDQSAIDDYFKGVRESCPSSVYLVSVYAKGDVCKHLTEIGYVSHTWLSESRGFSGYAEWKPKASIVQTGSTVYLGIDIDNDITNNSAGGWKLPVSK